MRSGGKHISNTVGCVQDESGVGVVAGVGGGGGGFNADAYHTTNLQFFIQSRQMSFIISPLLKKSHLSLTRLKEMRLLF